MNQLENFQNQLDAATEIVAPEIELQFKPMFGGACAYCKGRVFASLSNVGLALKLPPDAQDELLNEGGVRLQYEPDAPISKQYVVVPSSMREDAARLSVWVGRSLKWVASQPAPKTKRKKTV